MRREPERPTAVVVIAIFHFIFGGLGLLCDTCGIASQAMKMGQSPAQIQWQADIDDVMVERVPLYRVYFGANLVLPLVWDVVLIVSGIGLLNLRPWGRTLSLGYGIGRLVWGVVALAVTLVWAQPAMEEAMQRVKLPPEMQQMGGFLNAITSFGIGLQLVFLMYPAIVLIVMLLPAVRAAFAGGPPALDRFDDDEEDEDDDDDEDDRERPGGEGIQSRPRD